MADKPADKKPDDKAHAADPKDGGKGGGLLTKTPVLMGIVMLLEAAVLFAGFKFLGGGPKPAGAADVGHADGNGHDGKDGHGAGGKKDKKNTVELQVLEFRAINKVSGRTILFDVSIYASIKADHEEAVKKAFADRKALITDRVRTIIAQSDPEKLGGGSEPGLETLRRQVRYQLDEIIGEGMVDEVLVPRCIPFRADY
jgi:flagellar basal body-associated protein FliL